MAAKVLATNDDGVAARGFAALVDRLERERVPTVGLAPDGNRSGVSRHATFKRPVRVVRRPGEGENGLYACDGMPVDCVRFGMLGGLGADVELVVSGINHGPNLGDDTLGSGTVGAAVEGALLGARALAVSQQEQPGQLYVYDEEPGPVAADYAAAARIAVHFVRAMLEEHVPERALLNVNIPVRLAGPEVALTRLGRRFYSAEWLATTGEDPGAAAGFMTFGRRGAEPPPFELEGGTDFEALAAGRVAATPLSYAWHLEESDGAWAEAVCTRVARELAAWV